MKIRSVNANNRKRAFEIKTHSKLFGFPYSKAQPSPSPDDPITELTVDKELGKEAFQYTLESGEQGTVHIEQVLEYNKDPSYLRDQLLYRLTLVAQDKIEQTELSKREIIRRLRTSPAQLYRLLDQTNYRKSVDQMLNLLHVLDCEVELIVRGKSA